MLRPSENSAEPTAKSTRTLELVIEGMSCAGCSAKIEKHLRTLPGVPHANVNFANRIATLTIDGTAANPASVCAAIRAIGFAASAQDDLNQQLSRQRAADAVQLQSLQRAFFLAAACTLPVFILDMSGFGTHPTVRYLFFVLAGVVQFGPGWRFYRTGIPALLRGAPDMNSLVALGTSAAFFFSTVVTFAPQWVHESGRHVYFEASAVIITLVLLGRFLELRARGRAGEAIEKLMALQPQQVRRLQRPDFTAEESVPLAVIQTGDRLRILAGERIPVDAVIQSGESRVDESMLTGEPVPVLRTTGDKVFAGTLNQNGTLVVEAAEVGESTVLAGIVKMVLQAQSVKLPIQQLVDKVTLKFVPAVIALAVIAFAAWMLLPAEPSLNKALLTAVTVLIIACPCAMGLATPLSIMVATGSAAKSGVWFRRGDALQSLSECKFIAVDKTGTLTQGHPKVVALQSFAPTTEDELIGLSASLEQNSTHPLAAALINCAGERGITLTPHVSANTVAGYGIESEGGPAEDRLRVGSLRWLTQQAGPVPAEMADNIASWQSKAYTLVGATRGKDWLGIFAIADPIRASAPQAVRDWQQSGRKVVLITGDQPQTAEAVARQLGMDDVRAQVLPAQKADVVSELQQQGKTLFIGDGLNDAPALASADVSIAIGSGTDVAIHAAEVVLMNNDLNKVTYAMRLSAATLRNIRQNLVWAFGYNITLLPVAAGVIYPVTGILLSPMLAAGAMAASSVCVVFNALRLRHFLAEDTRSDN